MSHVKEPRQCQAAVPHNLAEVPCSVTYFLKLFSEKLQMGSRLIFARVDSDIVLLLGRWSDWLVVSFGAEQEALNVL